jgi:hypothetical protein
MEGPLFYNESKSLTLSASLSTISSDQIKSTSNNDYVLLSTLYTSNATIHDRIWEGLDAVASPDARVYAPIFHASPTPFSIHILNYNMLAESTFSSLLDVLPFVRGTSSNVQYQLLLVFALHHNFKNFVQETNAD